MIDLPPEATRVTLLRHGAVQGRAQVLRGALDEPLSPAGWQAMAAVLDRLGVDVAAVATSPRLRCRAFAQDWAGARGLPLTVLDDMGERRFGAWEGLTPEEAARQDPEAWRVFSASQRETAPPGGESLAEVSARVRAAWQDWLAGAPGGHRVLVTHGGVMAVLLMDWLGLAPDRIWRVALPPAGVVQVSVLAGHPPVLLGLNL